MSASMMLRGGLSNTTLQYPGVSSITRRCDADSVMTHAPGCPAVPSRATRDGRLRFAGARARSERASTMLTGADDLVLRHARRRGAVLFVIGPHARPRGVARGQFHEEPAFE